MPQKQYRPEEIIGKLREAEVLLSQGVGVEKVCRRIEVTKMTFYPWWREYGRLRVDQARQLKDLERENSRLKKLVADLSLEAQILKEAASGNC
jgi:transposase-like protein